MAPHIRKVATCDPLRDFAPVVATAYSTSMLVAARRLVLMGGTPAEFAATLRADHARWGELVRDARIKPE
jgi:tripartite-type tricarboxylate transporter receptor subunit TctC